MRIPVLLFAALSLNDTLTGQEQENKIERADPPTPVEKPVAAQSQGAMIKDFSDEPDRKPLDHED